MTDIMSDLGRLVPGDSSDVELLAYSDKESDSSDSKEGEKAHENESDDIWRIHFIEFDQHSGIVIQERTIFLFIIVRDFSNFDDKPGWFSIDFCLWCF